MQIQPLPIDYQRTLFRFLSKSARKGELANPALAAERIAATFDSPDQPPLSDIAASMQERVWRLYPASPDLRQLLADDPDRDLLLHQSFDWVTVGIYAFGLPPTKTRSGTAESAAHRALKEWAAANGELLGAPPDAIPVTERWFPSADESDVCFIGASSALIVEVRPDDAELHELQQALFKLVAMRAVMQAVMQVERRIAQPEPEQPDRSVRVLLVTERALPTSLTSLAELLNARHHVKFVK